MTTEEKLYGLKVIITEDRCLVCWKKLNPEDHTHKCIEKWFSREALALT